MNKKLLILIILSTFNSALAELYHLDFRGSKLKGLAALDLKLDIQPANSFTIAEELKIFSGEDENRIELEEEDLLYKFVDPENAFVRLFFKNPLEVEKLEVDGVLDRANYSGQANIEIAQVNYISDFGRNLNPEKIKSEIKITEDKEILPFLGISKANILGPKKLIYRPVIYLTVTGIETYGFSLSPNNVEARINNVKAKIINDDVVTAPFELDEELVGKDLEVELEIEVDNKVVSKKLGTMKIVESIK